jgi:hypothetical protein
VGMGVSLIDGVGVSLGGTGVGEEASSGGRLGIAEQPAKKMAIKRTWMSFCMMDPFRPL